MTPPAAALRTLTLSPSGNALAATATNLGDGSPQIWLIHTDGSGWDRLTGRLTFRPSFSPDGKWVVYFSQRNFLGLRSSLLDLRAVHPDGSGDHLVAADLPFEPSRILRKDLRLRFSLPKAGMLPCPMAASFSFSLSGEAKAEWWSCSERLSRKQA